MKAVVVDINGRNAIVLSKDGQFIKLRNSKQFKVGIEVDIPSRGMHRPYGFMMKTVAAAAAFVFTIGIGYGAYSYNIPFSYINVDINPSMEIVANRFDRILNVEAINDDGAKVLENHNYKNKTVNLAVEEIIKSASDMGYMKENASNTVMLTISSKDGKKAEEVEKKILESAKSEMDLSGMEADVLVESVSIERHDEARKLNISPGKLTLIEKLQDVAPDIKIEDYKDSPVKEIIKAINDQKKDSKKEEKNDVNKQENKEEGNLKEKDITNKNIDSIENNQKTGAIENDKGNSNFKNDKKIENQGEEDSKGNSSNNAKNNSKSGQNNNNKEKKDNTSGNTVNGKGRNK